MLKEEFASIPSAPIYIASVMLIIGAASLPYGYYRLLRLAATIAFAWAAIISHKREQRFLPWAFWLLALTFNPIVPIHFGKNLWRFIDIGAGLFLLLAKRGIQNGGEQK